jgi:hypothetical protein
MKPASFLYLPMLRSSGAWERNNAFLCFLQNRPVGTGEESQALFPRCHSERREESPTHARLSTRTLSLSVIPSRQVGIGILFGYIGITARQNRTSLSLLHATPDLSGLPMLLSRRIGSLRIICTSSPALYVQFSIVLPSPSK